MSKRRVVVTGLGAVTPIGNNVKDFWAGIREGKVGIGPITKFDTTDYKVKIAAEVKDFNAKDHMDPRSARRMDPFCQYAVTAAKEALEDSGIDMEKEDSFRAGVIVGSGIGSLPQVENNYEKILTKGPGKVNPLMVPMMISNMAAGNISIQFGLRGKLKNWKERPEKSDEISAVINQIYARTSHIKSGKIYAFAQPTIMGYGMGSGFELYVQDRAGGDIATLQEHANKFIAGLNQRPEISMAYTSFDTKFPQYMVEVDAVKCQRANVSASDVLSVLSGFIGGNYSSNFNRFSKLYRVMVKRRMKKVCDNLVFSPPTCLS